MDTIGLDQLQQLVRGKPGLIVGPSQSLTPGTYASTVNELASTYSVICNSLQEAVDRVVAQGHSSEADIRRQFFELANNWKPSPQLSQLAKVKWSAVLSASADIFFEQRMQSEADKRPGRRDPYRVDDLVLPLPPRCIPIFKLLGTILRQDFTLTTPAYLRKKATWRLGVPAFANLVAGNPVICIGMSEITSVLLDLLSEFVAGRSCAPSWLVLLRDDPIANNRQISEILDRRTRVSIVNATLGELIASIDAIQSHDFTPELPFSSATAPDTLKRLSRFDDVGTIVNLRTHPRMSAEEKNALREVLFSPSIPQWDPFAHNLDFKRSITTDLSREISELAATGQVDDHAFLIIGSAASGKTTLLKRLAFDLAKDDYLTIWQQPLFIPDPRQRLQALFREIVKSNIHRDKPILYFIDEPYSSHADMANIAIGAARASGVRLFAVVALRSTDSLSQNHKDIASRFTGYSEIQLKDALDEDEGSRLPQYIFDSGATASLEDAKIQCQVLSKKYTRDTLALMYWLLPQARSSIVSSVRGEFTRLGDLAGFRKMVIGDAQHSSKLLRDAYEMVAVASRYDVPLPVEVLVSALGVDYDPWLAACRPDGPAWGILYSDAGDDNSERYRTRNDVVTNLLVETINGGTQSRSAEVSILRRLIKAAEGQESPIYREFIVSVLVPHEKLNGLPYHEGRMLYEDAIAALAHPDQTLVHHMGLWINKQGRKCLEAARVLEQALDTPVYPYSDRGEASEHIYTSLAVAKLDATDTGELDWQEGKKQAIAHLQRARSESFFNSSAVQVEARVAARIIRRGDTSDIGDSFEVANRALGDLDRTMQLMRSPVQDSTGSSRSVEYLEAAREQVLSAISVHGDGEAIASEVWKSYRTQSGFIVTARQLLEQARQENRDKRYRKVDNYCQAARNMVESDGEVVSPELSEVQLHAIYEGFIQRYVMNPGHSHIDWERVEALAREANIGSDPSRGPMTQFILAIALAHRGQWVEADQHFMLLRAISVGPHVMWKPRMLLLQENGGPRSIQGTIRRVANEAFIYAEELQRDIKCERRGQWPRDGESAHVHIQFAFGGSTAIHRVI